MSCMVPYSWKSIVFITWFCSHVDSDLGT
jgi:hypothetical protein